MARASLGRTVLKWTGRIIGGLVVLVVVAVALGAGYEAYARMQAHAKYQPRGARFDIGGRKMHIDCRGQGAPTVIFEAGLDTNGSLAWDAVQDKIASVTRACSYDRAGVMWSDPKPGPQDGDAVADDLHKTLVAAGITGPIVMVGHSLGGPYIMSYTRKYPEMVKGMVFVDTSHPDQIERLAVAHLPKGVPFVMTAANALAWTGALRLIPDIGAPGMSRQAAEAGTAYLPESIAAATKEMESLPTILHQGGQLRTLGARPLVVLTAAKPMSKDMLKLAGMSADDGARMLAAWKGLQADEASWSSRSRQQLVTDSTHYIQFIRPDLVIQATKEVVAQVRADDAQGGSAPSPAHP